MTISELLNRIKPLDEYAMAKAESYQQSLAKPPKLPSLSVADVYIAAVQQANEQYADDTERTKAKETIYQTFQTSLQEVLTAEQYAELMRVREERRNQRLTH